MMTERDRVHGWGTVRAGLALGFMGSLLTLLCPLLLGAIGWSIRDEEKVSVLALVLLGTCLMGLFAGLVLFVAGAAMGAAVPTSAGRSWGVATCFLGPTSLMLLILLGGVGLDLLVVQEIERKQQQRELMEALGGHVAYKPDFDELKTAFSADERTAILYVVQGAWVLTFVCRLLMMRAAARSLGRRALTFGIGLCLIVCLGLVAGVNRLALDRALDEQKLRLLIGGGLGGIVLMQAWYMLLSSRLRHAVGIEMRDLTQSVAVVVSSGE